MAKPKGYSLHIGLNHVDPNAYGGWDGELNACKRDAQAMATLAASRNFEQTRILLDSDATRQAVQEAIENAAGSLKAGDYFFLTYSGHGGRLPDRDGKADEKDRKDETWCLWDGEMLDDEIRASLADMAKGVRVLAFSDSCHSGTVLKSKMMAIEAMNRSAFLRAIPPAVQAKHYRKNKKFYEGIRSKMRKAPATLAATCVLISGCADNQFSEDGEKNGLFTGTLLKVWNKGKFTGSLVQFHKEIVKRMPSRQTPQFFRTGNVDAAFEAARPFTL